MKGFGSDNHAPVHPDILNSIVKANQNHAPSYGTDDISMAANLEFKKIFGSQVEVFFVFNGTAANVLSLMSLMQSPQAILCTDISHLQQDECGAPEFFTGGKLIPRPSQNGKFILADLERSIIRRGDQHHSQIKAISLTQPTEVGTVYTIEEMKNISLWAKSQNLKIHLDGARLCNAAYSLGVSLKELTTDLGIDVVSFGGTKNGFLFGEAILFLNPELAKDFKFLRKQAAQLPSKTRFIACQFLTYLQNNLYLKIASHSCRMASILAQGIESLLKKYPQYLNNKNVFITQPIQSNAVFLVLPKAWIKTLRKNSFFYIWDETTFECRLMCSWDTSEEEIVLFLETLDQLMKITLNGD